MKSLGFVLILVCLFVYQATAQFTVVSPDRMVETKVNIGESISYSVSFNGKAVWDDTKVLNGQIGEYITMARKSEDEWYIGSMTNSFARELEIKLDFLGDMKYKMVSFADAPDSGIDATKLVKSETTVKKGETVKIKMASGGGFVAYLVPIK